MVKIIKFDIVRKDSFHYFRKNNIYIYVVSMKIQDLFLVNT